MADLAFDAIIIGGGNKGLILGMYLARYGGMSVGIFEKRHEAGGGWCTDEGAAPGFLGDYHATGAGTVYHMATQEDFPEWQELGGKLSSPKVSSAGIFKEDDSYVIFYSRKADQSGELTAKSIAKHSERDAEAWLKYQDLYINVWLPYYLEWLNNPAVPLGEPDGLDKLIMDPKSGIDPGWLYKTPLEVMRDVFESDALINLLMRLSHSLVTASSDASGMGLHSFWGGLGAPYARGVIGGTHSFAHAAVKIFLSDSGKIFNQKEVDKVIIENGRAKGVILTDGSQVEARKVIISTLDPYNLCFRLIGKEHLDWRTLRRVENLERRETCITWYTWALHERPHYKVAEDNPDMDEVLELFIVSKDPEALAKLRAKRIMGMNPGEEDLELMVMSHSTYDKTRAPEGKFALLTEHFVMPANELSEDEWLEYKSAHAEDIMNLWGKHTTNMSWDNVIGYIPLTPYDHCRLANMAPTGNWAIIDNGIASQWGRYRPVPELAGHKTPIENLFATGSAWHPFACASSWQGYNCYKVIARDFSLRKPWEEKGRPW